VRWRGRRGEKKKDKWGIANCKWREWPWWIIERHVEIKGKVYKWNVANWLGDELERTRLVFLCFLSVLCSFLCGLCLLRYGLSFCLLRKRKKNDEWVVSGKELVASYDTHVSFWFKSMKINLHVMEWDCDTCGPRHWLEITRFGAMKHLHSLD
jgi:hypothetical protein